MGQSNGLVVALIAGWCLVGGLVGWLGDLAYRRFAKSRPIPAGIDWLLGASGALAGALWSGVVDQDRPPLPSWPEWVRPLGRLVADHQMGFAVALAAALVLAANFVTDGVRKWRRTHRHGAV